MAPKSHMHVEENLNIFKEHYELEKFVVVVVVRIFFVPKHYKPFFLNKLPTFFLFQILPLACTAINNENIDTRFSTVGCHGR